MGRFTPHYTTEQEQAIAGAMLGDYGRPMTARQACEAAQEGRLGLESFAVKIKAAYVIRDRVGQQRNPPKPIKEQTLEDRAMTLLEAKMRKLERDQKAGSADVFELRTVIRAIAELRRSQKSMRPAAEPGTPPEPQDLGQDPEPISYLARIAAEQNAEEAQDHEGHEDDETSGHDEHDETEDERGAMPVRSDAGEEASCAVPLARMDRGVYTQG